jgi:tetratricopeptide (TPR) repeat protein
VKQTSLLPAYGNQIRHSANSRGALLACLFALLVPCQSLFAADALQHGRAWLAEGDSAAAVQSYAELVRQNPFDPVALNNMAVAKAASGDYQSALELLTRAAKIAPHRQDIRDNLSHLQNWQQQTHSVKLGTAQPVLRPQTGNNGIWPEPPALWSATVARPRP